MSIASSASLDLASNDLIVTATPDTKQQILAALSNAIRSARGVDGKWTGGGLTSSAAKANKQTGLSILLNEKNGKPILTTFAGQSVTEDDILVKYTWNGDVNLDGKVDASDYFLIDSAFIAQTSVLAAEVAPMQVKDVVVPTASVLQQLFWGKAVL